MTTSTRILQKLCGSNLCRLKLVLPTSDFAGGKDENSFMAKSFSSSTSNNHAVAAASSSLNATSKINSFQYFAKRFIVKYFKSQQYSIAAAPCTPSFSFPITNNNVKNSDSDSDYHLPQQPTTTSLFVNRLKPRIPWVSCLFMFMMNRRRSALAFPCGHLFTSSSTTTSSNYKSPPPPPSSSSENKKSGRDKCSFCSTGCMACQSPWVFLGRQVLSSLSWSSPRGCLCCLTGCVMCLEPKSKMDEVVQCIAILPFTMIAIFYLLVFSVIIVIVDFFFD
ncbi:hypothetical protein ACOSP7_012585 [Xanthoceras sorbifolium]